MVSHPQPVGEAHSKQPKLFDLREPTVTLFRRTVAVVHLVHLDMGVPVHRTAAPLSKLKNHPAGSGTRLLLLKSTWGC
jgi:hypothetical protein